MLLSFKNGAVEVSGCFSFSFTNPKLWTSVAHVPEMVLLLFCLRSVLALWNSPQCLYARCSCLSTRELFKAQCSVYGARPELERVFLHIEEVGKIAPRV